ncbi:amino acid adenylation domain [Fusarium albosuccineum]|uniref:Amino acid adenylation domain n=1 Tax=Fusarium albosuccineum TaxID=1237068 RepID=A0A8H4LQG7_9HYPO|nr:amino acid adenylation domain [Fusarium albosuccineum]
MPLYQDDMCLLSGPPVANCSASSTRRGPVTPQSVYPMTKSQEAMWIEFQSEPQSTHYNLTLEWDVKDLNGSEPSIKDILQVILKITARHAILRSLFTLIHGEPHVEEYEADDVDPDVRVVFRQRCPLDERAVTQILRKPFMLQHEFPVRWVIVQDPEAFRVYIVTHHIAIDGQSMSIISREFLDLLNNPDAVLPLGVPFSNAHMKERASSMSSVYTNNRKLLLSQLQFRNTASWPGVEPNLDGSSVNFREIDSWHTFPKTELDSKPNYGRSEVISLGFGGRPRGMETSVGQFANPLPAKIPLWEALETESGSFKSLVSAVSKNISAIKRAELVPSLDLVRACRDLNLDYEPPRVTVTYSPKLAKSGCRLFPVEGSWDLFFCFLEYEDNVKLGVIYNPQKFSSSALVAMKSTFNKLFALSKIDGTQLAAMIPWLPRYPSLPKAPAQHAANPMKHVHHWFDAHAETTPHALALTCSELEMSMTYGDLGVQRGDKVLVHLQRGFAVIEWILAILKAGAAFVYLDQASTAHQYRAIVENCQPVLVVNEAMSDEQNVVDLSVGNNLEDESKFSTADDDLAYIIYTSGSTGEPKGVMVEHGNLAAFARTSTEVFEVGFGTRVLQLASFSFDASILEWTNASSTGACLCFAEHPKHLVGEYLAQVIDENKVTFMQITPTALETLPLDHDLPSLRQISVGGEAPSHELFSRWHDRVNLVNAYGPTETAIAVAFNKIHKSDQLPPILSVGRPNPQTNVYVCSEGLGPTNSTGKEGEICISGPQVARGYCENPTMTAKNFPIHPSGVRMYRTGDRGLLLEDGSIVVKGRIDRELKVRGFRIAPEEISSSGLELLAFVAPDTISAGTLLDALGRILPSHKIPSKIYPVKSLPKNASGKIDHKAVRGMMAEYQNQATKPALHHHSDEGTESDDLDDFDESPDIVSRIWQDVLNLPSSPPTDVNFFDMGGHSLLVPKLHQKLRAAFPSSPVRLVDLFHKSTISSQAQLFQQQTKSSGTIRPMPLTTRLKTPVDSDSSPSPGNETPITEYSDVPATGACPIAIVGMSGRFPGAGDVNSFYEMLANSESGIRASESTSEPPVLPGNSWVPKAGRLDHTEDFDPDFWNLSEEDATEMDPQQRLFLEVAYEALFDAGINAREMRGERMGVFVGSANPAYHLHTESVASDSFLRENRGFVAPSISARTAYHLDLRGPNMTIQTNCASSTIALSQAFDAIRLGQCDMAIVGGISVQIYDGGYITKDGQIFSPRGECNPFDSRADGTVPGDAVTAVVLKKYSAAVNDGTAVYATILGTGIGSDGACDKVGYQVPSPRGQADVIKSAWEVAGLTATTLKYAEIHGSGTPIGDALELQGLGLAITELGGSDEVFTVGSTKGNIGNTQHSSGLVSLIKLCKSMQAGVVAPTKGLEQPSALIEPNLPLKLALGKTRVDFGDALAVSAAGWGGVEGRR